MKNSISNKNVSIQKLIEILPHGTSEAIVNNKKYLITRKDFNGGKSSKVYAEELGGKDFISFNLYLTSNGEQFKPCEMPPRKVIDFLWAYNSLFIKDRCF